MTLASRPLVWFGLLAMWLLLNGSISPGQLLLGVIVGGLACRAALPVLPPKSTARNIGTMVALLLAVIVDVVKSNIAVLGIILSGRSARSAFVDIPLELTNDNGLAILACIVTATPGSAWIQHNSRRSVVTIHILDVEDPDAWAADLKRNYEKRLMEIFE